MTDVELDAIDRLAGRSSPVVTSVVLTEPNVSAELAALGVVNFSAEPDAKPRRKYERSRWAVFADGRKAEVLYVLATAVKGAALDVQDMPFWIDGDSTHEVTSNVKLATQPGQRQAGRNPYGFPAGSKEYNKAYRAAHKAEMNTAQKKYEAKKRAALKHAKTGLKSVDDGLSKLQELHRRILGDV